MSMILFFGLALIVIIVGTVYSFLVIRHHFRLSMESRRAKSRKNLSQELENPS